MDNAFIVTVLSDGKIRITAPGGFSKELHTDADQLLEMIKALAGGDCETKQLKPHLGNPHAHGQHHGHGHRH